MRAITLDSADSSPALDELPEPTPGEGQVLVRVRGSSVNPVDNAIAAGMLQGMAEHRFPVTLGRDFAGVVEGAGPGVDRFSDGDEVFGFLLHADPEVHAGAWSELIAAPADRFIAAKPEGTGFPEAGVAPLAALTAFQAVDALELSEGETILIIGASGGVGSFAVQIAKLAGARVIAPGLPEDGDFLAGLGVDEVVPRDDDVVAAVRGLAPEGTDALIDTVSMSADALNAYAATLSRDGRAASPVGAAGEGEGRHDVMASADPTAVERLAGLLADGELAVPIHRSYDLPDATRALADLSGEHTQGKLAIRIG
jgi:NADPH2:quinone reductase